MDAFSIYNLSMCHTMVTRYPLKDYYSNMYVLLRATVPSIKLLCSLIDRYQSFGETYTPSKPRMTLSSLLLSSFA